MSDAGRFRRRASAILALLVLIVVAGHLSDDEAWDDAALGAVLIAAPLALIAAAGWRLLADP